MDFDCWACQVAYDAGEGRCAYHLPPVGPPDPVRDAYDRGELPTQTPCPCCMTYCPEGCAEAVRELQTGRCTTKGCKCYGTLADGGICEDCYVSTK